MQTEVTKGQLQPVIASMVAGVNWGQTFIAEDVLPPTNTGGEQFMYETYDNAGMVDQGSTKRGLRAESKILGVANSSTVQGSLEDFSAKIPTDIREIEAAQVQDLIRSRPAAGLNSVDRLRFGRARILQFNNQIQKEKAVSGLVFDPTKYAAGLQSTSLNLSTCKISDIKDAMREVQKRFGFLPDTFVLGYKSRSLLDENTNILNRISGGATAKDAAVISDDLIASLFGVRRLKVGTAVVQPLAAPGVTPDPATALWTEDAAALIYTGEFETADLASPAFGKVFYTEYPETDVRYTVRTWMNDEGNIEWIKAAEMFRVAQVMQAGYIFTNTDQS